MNPEEAAAQSIELSDLDRILLTGIHAREREILHQFILPWQDDYQKVLRDIEQRHSLSVGAIGTTHRLDQEKMSIMLADKPAAPEAPGTPGETPNAR